MKKYLNLLLSIIYLISGIIISFYWIWLRLVKERIPHELFFNWNIWFFISYTLVFLLFFSSVKEKIYTRESKNKIIIFLKTYIIEKLFSLLIKWYENSLHKLLEFILKENFISNYEEKTQPYLMAFFKYLAKNLPFANSHRGNLLLIIGIMYIPRLIISILFFTDIIILNKFFYFYKYIWLLLFPFFWNIIYGIVEYMYTEYMITFYEVFIIKHIPFTPEEREKEKSKYGGFYIDMQRTMNPKHIDLPLDAEQNMRDYYQCVLLPIKILFINQFDKYVYLKKFFIINFFNLITDIFYSITFGYLMLKTVLSFLIYYC